MEEPRESCGDASQRGNVTDTPNCCPLLRQLRLHQSAAASSAFLIDRGLSQLAATEAWFHYSHSACLQITWWRLSSLLVYLDAVHLDSMPLISIWHLSSALFPQLSCNVPRQAQSFDISSELVQFGSASDSVSQRCGCAQATVLMLHCSIQSHCVRWDHKHIAAAAIIEAEPAPQVHENSMMHLLWALGLTMLACWRLFPPCITKMITSAHQDPLRLCVEHGMLQFNW